MITNKLKGNVWVKINESRIRPQSRHTLIKLKEAEIIDTRMLGEDVYVDVDKDQTLSA